MARFYFTYGSDSVHHGGWTEVEASDIWEARELYKRYYPPKDGLMVCCDVYTEDRFTATSMGKTGKNLGHGCWDFISKEGIRNESIQRI